MDTLCIVVAVIQFIVIVAVVKSYDMWSNRVLDLERRVADLEYKLRWRVDIWPHE